MERENFRSAELTGGIPNTYSMSRGISMAENTGETQKTKNPIKRESSRNFSADPRQAAFDYESSIRGRQLTSEESQVLKLMREFGMPPIAGGSDTDPNDQEGNEASPPEPIAGPQGEASPEEQRLRGESGLSQGREDEIDSATRIEQARLAKEYAQRELTTGRVISWIIDPEKREEYFNDLYAIVDSRPYDFWQTAFDPLTDGAKEHHFNQTLLLSAKRRWDEIEAGHRQYGSANITGDKIKAALKEKYSEKYQDREVSEEDLIEVSREIAADFERLQRERQVRRTLHDVNAVLYLPQVKAEELFANMSQFDSTSGDLALSITGVREMMNIYENVLREIMAENDGWLPSERVLGKASTIIKGEKGNEKSVRVFSRSEAETRTKERFRKLADAGLLVTRAKTKNEDNVWEAAIEGGLEDWEVDRVFTLARGMMIMEERLISLAAESKLPANEVRYASGFLQPIIQSTSVYAHLVTKWGITQEAMAAYLFPESVVGNQSPAVLRQLKKARNFFSGWDPGVLKEAFESYKENPEMLFESLDKTFYLGRRNPNRAGDIYTWISWRGVPKPDVPSMIQDFLVSGQERMRERWERDHPGTPIPGKYLNEYEKWTGTGFRFEKLRGALSGFDSPNGKDRSDFKKAFEQAKPLIGRMVDLQPHRIYLVSRWVRERVDRDLTDEQFKHTSLDLENLSMVESAFLNSRETLLDKGIGFDEASLDAKKMVDNEGNPSDFYELAIKNDYKDKDGNVIFTAAQQIQRAKDLAKAIKKDFEREKKRKDHKNQYWKEFIFKREFSHGYVLWSGDTPADEYNFSALGATGGFVRRATDNDHQVKAATAELTLLDNLKNIQTPDQLAQALFEVFSHIDKYERGKAQQAIADKAEGFIKFFKSNWMTNIPGYKLLPLPKDMKRASFAQMMYGREAPIWESSDINLFLRRLKDKKMITEEQEKLLKDKTGATIKHVSGEAVITFAQLIALALALVTVDVSAKAIKEGEGTN